MESQTLKIPNVDFALLDSQRLTLATIPRDAARLARAFECIGIHGEDLTPQDQPGNQVQA